MSIKVNVLQILVTQTSCELSAGREDGHEEVDRVDDDGSDRKSGEAGYVRDDSGSGSGDDDDKSTIPEQGRIHRCT